MRDYIVTLGCELTIEADSYDDAITKAYEAAEAAEVEVLKVEATENLSEEIDGQLSITDLLPE